MQLKKAKVTRTDLGLFYSSCIRSIMDYAVPAFHFSLPKYLMQELERVQKRAMSIIYPGVSYHEALVIMNFKELATYNDEICESLFHTIVKDNNHRLYKLLPAPHESTYSLRRALPLTCHVLKPTVLRIGLLSFHVLKQLTYRLEFRILYFDNLFLASLLLLAFLFFFKLRQIS